MNLIVSHVKKEQKKIDAIVKELRAVLRAHHVPMNIRIQAMREFYAPMRMLELSIEYETEK